MAYFDCNCSNNKDYWNTCILAQATSNTSRKYTLLSNNNTTTIFEAVAYGLPEAVQCSNEYCHDLRSPVVDETKRFVDCGTKCFTKRSSTKYPFPILKIPNGLSCFAFCYILESIV
jgi:hypothetical protein